MKTQSPAGTHYPLTLYFDGACAACNLEMDNLQARNAAGLLRFVDISTPSFDPALLGVSLQALNGLLHAQRPDGSLVVGVEVFRLAYGAVGLGRWTAPTQWRLVAPWIEQAYAVFARNRYGISRATMPMLQWLRRTRAQRRASRLELAAQQATQTAAACHNGVCKSSTGDKA